MRIICRRIVSWHIFDAASLYAEILHFLSQHPNCTTWLCKRIIFYKRKLPAVICKEKYDRFFRDRHIGIARPVFHRAIDKRIPDGLVLIRHDEIPRRLVVFLFKRLKHRREVIAYLLLFGKTCQNTICFCISQRLRPFYQFLPAVPMRKA